MNVDYIIVGLGLAGLAFAEELLENNKSFIVFEDASQTSSLVAGGMYNPVILKRFTPVWNGHQQLELALPFYQKLEEKFTAQFDTKFATKKIFSSVGDENNWFIASDKPMLSHYMIPTVKKDKIKGVIGDFGYGELKGTGRVDTDKLLRVYRNSLEKNHQLRKEAFNYDDLVITDDFLNYKDIKAKKIVFSEGFGLKKNPFFNFLPLNGTKGELITIHAPELDIDFLLKSTVFILPLGNHYYRVGATFNWTDKTSIPTEEGKNELVEKLKKVLSVPYTIVNQSAGIRPTVKDRRPLVGVHPNHSQLYVLNGLGTRGVMIAPTVAKNLYGFTENNEDLDPEIDIKRFE
ncbi:FAD-binding oxidoreductase [Tenacibaculum sp. IB213877]|uniref:NAD(P)/FAD-dependent oxidoreductase n=1 Tax=Tenacibaculum sp. IB213877 TaxID=3097351 RepID=UPI002A599AE1|nr:FAD-binding oxidoreductase [Tenacibaculum sp. IB213877]MDY0780234.1 FAD-binding oxidoreductase [Tenacibaculum sp. IB213877]